MNIEHACDALEGVGERLRILRKERGLNNFQISKMTGLSRSALAQWMSGGTLPNSYSLTILCAFFGVSADWLLGLSNVKYIADGGFVGKETARGERDEVDRCR